MPIEAWEAKNGKKLWRTIGHGIHDAYATGERILNA
jgi:hypothetical protein